MPSVLGCMAFVGILSLANKLNYKNSILAFLMLSFSWMNLFSYLLKAVGFAHPFLAGLVYSVLLSHKLFPHLIFFVLSAHYVLKKEYFIAIVFLLFLPVASFIAAPTIISFVWFCIVFSFLRDKKEFNYTFALFFAVYNLIFACYYFFWWDKLSAGFLFSAKHISLYLSSFTSIIKLIIYLLPFVLILVLLYNEIMIEKKTKWLFTLFYSILLTISILISILMIGSFDGIQFFTNIFVPISTCFFSVFFLRIESNNWIYKFILLLLLSSSTYQMIKSVNNMKSERFEQDFITKINHEIKNDNTNKPIYCGFINSDSFYSIHYLYTISKVFKVGESLDAYRNDIIQVGLSDYVAYNWLKYKYRGDEVTKEQALMRIPEGTFYKYVELEKNKRSYVSLDKSQVNFILKLNIRYIFIQKDASISSELSERIKLLASEKKAKGYSLYYVVK